MKTLMDTHADFSFWPDNGPWWDSVGVDDVGSIVLVEEILSDWKQVELSCKVTATGF